MRETNRSSLSGQNGSRHERRVSGLADRSRGVDPDELTRRELRSITEVSRRFSLNRDDADEAVQRGLEILLRRADSLDPTTAGAWLRTVVKHEAFAVRAERLKAAPTDPDDLDLFPDPTSVPETANLMERLSLAAEAMSLIKPGEAEALMLQAEGLSYKDIAQAKGWTYTKVNRLINEGSKAFREKVDEIERGTACVDLLKQTDGGLKGSHRRHLLRCAACRADVRKGQLGAWLPAMFLPALLDVPARIVRSIREAAVATSDRLVGGALKAQSAIEAASSGKAVAIAASAAAMAGGGVVAVHSAERPHEKQRATAIETSAVMADPSSSRPEDAVPPSKDLEVDRQSSERQAPVVAPSEAPAVEFGPGEAPSATTSAAAPRAQSAGRTANPAGQQSTEFGP